MENLLDESKQGESLVLEAQASNTRKLYIESYGCAMNFSDSEIVASILANEGFNTTSNLEDADLVLMLKSHEKHQPKRLHLAQERGVPVHVVRNNTVTQMTYFLRSLFDRRDAKPDRDAAMREVERAVHDVIDLKQPVELAPQNTYVRRLQHQYAEGYGLTTESTGADPHRRVVIFPA